MSANTNPQNNVTIVVLGDIGRSPRMQYHALSLAKSGHKVDVIGYGETQPFQELKKEPLLSYHYLLAYPKLPLPRLLNYAFKTLWQAVSLFFMLLITRRPNVILVQNPPAVPTLAVCLFFKYLFQAKLIVDWHNYAHSIMGLSVGTRHVLVKITKILEFSVGRKADTNFCVTNYMKQDLYNNHGIQALTLYDRPADKFRSIPLEEKHEFFNKIGQSYPQFMHDNRSSNIFTQELDGKIISKPNRPGLLVSSTSWTEDEDFSILFSVLQDYENHIESGNSRKLPDLFCVITGKGPLKEYYTSKINSQHWTHVSVIMPWLQDEQYPKMLASADLGVSLHISSSGLDLPMKVVDMFGCCLPVCAYDFPCLHELVQHGRNGYTFKNSKELSTQILNWFENFPNNSKQQETEKAFKENLKTFQTSRWHKNWQDTVQIYFK